MSQVKTTEALAFQPPPEMLERFCRTLHVAPSAAALPYAKALFEELKRYLVVLAVMREHDPEARCSPPVALDQIWHHFICDDTRVYMGYCDMYLGGYVHHQAGGNYPPDQLKSLARDLGISLDPQLWEGPKPVEFGQCG